MKILLTTTNYQDTPGPHHHSLESNSWKIVREQGPLPEARMLELAGEFYAFLCGDDGITKAVIERSLPKLKCIREFGIGLDRIDVDFAISQNLPVLFMPEVNHKTVAERAFGLLFGITKRIVTSVAATGNGEWLRLTGHEMMGKTIGIVGLGCIGKEVALRAKAFGMSVIARRIGSRTHESVIRQATMATENLIRVLKGEVPLAQANRF